MCDKKIAQKPAETDKNEKWIIMWDPLKSSNLPFIRKLLVVSQKQIYSNLCTCDTLLYW